MTLDDIKARCRIDEETGCWLWTGALTKGAPSIWAPDEPGGPKKVTNGRRAVWVLVKGTKPPARVFGTCGCKICLNPEHLDGGSYAKHGAFLSKSGQFQNSARRKAAARANARKLTNLTPEIVSLIRNSDKPGTVIGRELGLAQQTVSAVRTGKRVCFDPVGGIFSQLLR